NFRRRLLFLGPAEARSAPHRTAGRRRLAKVVAALCLRLFPNLYNRSTSKESKFHRSGRNDMNNKSNAERRRRLRAPLATLIGCFFFTAFATAQQGTEGQNAAYP